MFLGGRDGRGMRHEWQENTQDSGGDTWNNHLEDLVPDGSMILKKRLGGHGLDLFGSGERPLAGCCEHGNKSFSSVKYGNLLNHWTTIDFPPGILSKQIKIIISGIFKGVYLCHSQYVYTNLWIFWVYGDTHSTETHPISKLQPDRWNWWSGVRFYLYVSNGVSLAVLCL